MAEWQFRRSVVSWKRPRRSSPPGRAYLCGDLANALIDVIEKAIQISHDTIDEQTFQPFNDCVDDKSIISSFSGKGTTVTLAEQAGQQRDKLKADQNDTAAAMSCFIPN